jgi:hypothetical protein
MYCGEIVGHQPRRFLGIEATGAAHKLADKLVFKLQSRGAGPVFAPSQPSSEQNISGLLPEFSLACGRFESVDHAAP